MPSLLRHFAHILLKITYLGQSSVSVNNKHEGAMALLIVKIKLLPELLEDELREKENHHEKNSEARSQC